MLYNTNIVEKNRLNITEFYIFLIHEKLPNKISKQEWLILLENNNHDDVWKFLLNNNVENYYNFILTLKIFKIYFKFDAEFFNLEKKIYQGKKEFEIWFLIIKTLEIILKNNFNEITQKDALILNKTNPWTTITLDSLYFLDFDHFNYGKFLKKKKDPILYKKILNINLIVGTLEKFYGIWFYNKLKKCDCPDELIKNINFTKGYLICFMPELFDFLKHYKYERKLINSNPKSIVILKKKLNFKESLSNGNYSHPIWLNEKNFNIIEHENIKIFNKKLLNKPNKIKISVSVLNFLNSTELIYDKDLLNSIDYILKKNANLYTLISSKNSFKNDILHLNNKENLMESEYGHKLNSLVQSASVWELIKTQLIYYDSFFLDHRLDHRLRIYCYPWPINYQLNHVIRCILKFKNKPNILKIWKDFWNYSLIKKYFKNNNIFEYNQNEIVKKQIDDFFKKKNNFSETFVEDDLKKEFFFQIIVKIVPRKFKNLNEKIDFILEILDEFLLSDLKKDWNFWIKKLDMKEKKLPYLLVYQQNLINLFKNNFDSIFWADASSNAIQLIVFRLNLNNKFLLKLTNICDNDTNYSNIYEYVTEEIKKQNHDQILIQLNNKLKLKEIIDLQEIDNNKYLLMPSSYGMGKFAYREKLNSMLSSDERSAIWNKLNNKEKTILSDYFWNSADKILTDIGFPINKYKNICNNFYKNSNCEAFIWKNDIGITVAPISILNSKRNDILKKINILKLKEKETSDEKVKMELKKNIQKYKLSLEQDDKKFWKRSMIKSCKHKIFSRIYFKQSYQINKIEMQQSLIPNTIHTYDAAVIHLTVQICKKLNIQVLCIHDSVGCHPLLLPLVKIIFKIANILLLDINSKNPPFPLKKKDQNVLADLDRLFEEILKSKNFFK